MLTEDHGTEVKLKENNMARVTSMLSVGGVMPLLAFGYPTRGRGTHQPVYRIARPDT